MRLPQANATLTAVSGGGLSEDDGGSYTGSADSAKWTGSADAYVSEEVLTDVDATGLNEAKRTFIVIPGDLQPTFVLRPEDTVTYTYAGASHTREIEDFAARLLAGHLPTVRCILRDT